MSLDSTQLRIRKNGDVALKQRRHRIVNHVAESNGPSDEQRLAVRRWIQQLPEYIPRDFDSAQHRGIRHRPDGGALGRVTLGAIENAVAPGSAGTGESNLETEFALLSRQWSLRCRNSQANRSI